MSNINIAVPFFSQRENKYEWYFRLIEKKRIDGKPYNKGDRLPGHKPESLADSSCNITCLAMVLNFLGITKDTPDVMMQKVFADGKNGAEFDRYLGYVKRYPNDLSKGYECIESPAVLKAIAEDIYHIRYAYVGYKYNLEEVKKEVNAGFPVIVNCGIIRPSFAYLQKHHATSSSKKSLTEAQQDATWSYHGHYVVIRGFTEGGDVILNDPWGKATNEAGKLPTEEINNNIEDAWGNYPTNKTANTNNGENVIIKEADFLRQYKNVFQEVIILYDRRWSFPYQSISAKWIKNGQKFVPGEEQFEECYEMESLEIHFPITDTCTPHVGVQLQYGYGSAVSSIGSGIVIAAKLAMRCDEQLLNGDNCMLLVKHDARMSSGTIEPFFVLYEHLQPVKLDIAKESPYRFVNELREKSQENNKYSQICIEKLNSLQQGYVVVLNDTSGLIFEIAEGDFVGTSGEKGFLPGTERSCIHWEIFTSSNILRGESQNYTELDFSSVNMYDREETIQTCKKIVFGTELNTFRHADKNGISAKEVNKFYSKKGKKQTRTIVCKAKSEWAADRDFSKDFKDANKKGFLEITQDKNIDSLLDFSEKCVAPYLWWDEKVNSALNKEVTKKFINKIAYYYHPVRFLYWLMTVDEAAYKKRCPQHYTTELKLKEK